MTILVRGGEQAAYFLSTSGGTEYHRHRTGGPGLLRTESAAARRLDGRAYFTGHTFRVFKMSRRLGAWPAIILRM